MAIDGLWTALERAASVWRDSPVCARFAAALPRNASQQVSGLSGRLQEFQALGAPVSETPLRLASFLPLLESLPGGHVPNHGEDHEWDVWLADAQAVETAHRRWIAWLRSRMPGYPFNALPLQLAAGTQLTTPEYTRRLMWTPQERGSGLQLQDSPSQVNSLLRIDAQALHRAAQNLATQFGAASQWKRMRRAKTQLDADARASLRRVRQELSSRLVATAVDEHEERFALPRDEYRRSVVSEAIDQLSGPAREYCDSFTEANDLLETVGSDIFGQLVVYKSENYGKIRDLVIEGNQEKVLRFELDLDTWPHLGAVAWIDDPLVDDAVHVTATGFSFDSPTNGKATVTARVLDGSGAEWGH